MPAIDEQIEIEKQIILNQIGYDGEYQPSGRVASLVDDYIDNYHDLIAPSYSYTIRDIEFVDGKHIGIGDSIIVKSKILAVLLARCRKVAVFTLTIGSYLEEMVAYLAESHLVLQATVLDAIGSGTAEKLADQVEKIIKVKVGTEGLVASWRFSPGYCDWEVSQQKAVFQAMQGDTAGVRLTESMLMIPRKSISGIIGVGLPGNGIEEYNPCLTCKKKDCPGRRK